MSVASAVAGVLTNAAIELFPLMQSSPEVRRMLCEYVEKGNAIFSQVDSKVITV
jgi:hypothetical protein